MPVRAKQLKLNHEVQRRFGGRQAGAGRPPGPRPRVLHRVRESFLKDHPVHVTFRVRSDVPALRQPRFIRAFRRTLREGCDRDGFRVIHYSVQRDHVHCVVEANSKQALGSGMKSLGARFARAVNRVFSRSGPVLDGRYHARVLKTPNEVRRALAYVLLNARKHFKQRLGYAPPTRLGDYSASGRGCFVRASTLDAMIGAPEGTALSQRSGRLFNKQSLTWVQGVSSLNQEEALGMGGRARHEAPAHRALAA